ncbi:MAG: glycosyltransferase [Methylobacteriaceae bacterium]|nr:glycosyltransferase [Methylobacteriaceae bacterium]
MALGSAGRLVLVEQNAVSVGGHYFAYSRNLARAGLASGLPVTILQNVGLTGGWDLEGVEALPTFTKRRTDPDTVTLQPWRRGNIAFEWRRSLAAHPVSSNDHILFSTLSFTELLQLLHLLTTDIASWSLARVHLLLRYDPEMLSSNIGLFNRYFMQIRSSPVLGSRILFHSDTDELARELHRLTGLPVTTLPIAFDQARLKERLAGRRPAGERPLVATYLGDARLEKTYQSLPDAVARLWPDYVRTGRLRFVIQSNFNVPGGEPGILDAAERLGRYLPDEVELLPEPLLPDAYYDRVAEADILLVPYDAERYRLRSSGILVEGLAAGKPAVTSAGSWMAAQLDADQGAVVERSEELGPAIAQVVDDYPRYRAACEAQAPARLAGSTGERFIAELLRAGRARSDEDAPRIVAIGAPDDYGPAGAGGLGTFQRCIGWLDEAGFQIELALVPGSSEAADVHLTGGERAILAAGAHLLPARPRDDVQLICAIDDLAAARTARAEERAVGRQEIEAELDALGRCDRVLCGDDRLAATLERSRRGIAAVSIPPDRPLAPASIASLAGALTLADVAIRSGAARLSEGADADDLASRLADLDSLDLVLVRTGSELCEESDARWFVDAVYRPYLAPAGISLVMAGFTSEAGERHDAHLIRLGPVLDAAPLYAAARLAVVAAREPSGAADRAILEALRHGTPVLAHSAVAARWGEASEAIRFAGDPTSLATLALRLLGSGEELARMVEGSRRHGWRQAGERAEERAFAEIFGSAARAPSRSVLRQAAPTLVTNWGATARLVNGLVRSWLAAEPFSASDLEAARSWPREQVCQDISAALASLAEPGGFARLAGASGPPPVPGFAMSAQACGEALQAIAVAMADPAVDHLGANGAPILLAALDTYPVAFARLGAETDVGAADKSRRPGAVGRIRPIRAPLPCGPELEAWLIATQIVPLVPVGCRVLGRPLIETEWDPMRDGNNLVLRRGETATLTLPAMLSDAAGFAFLELVSDAFAELLIEVSGTEAAATEMRSGAIKLWRLPAHMPRVGILQVRVTAVSDTALLLQARGRLVLGPAEPPAAAVLGASLDLSPSESTRAALALAVARHGAARDHVDVLRAASRGRVPHLAAAHRLKTALDELLDGSPGQPATRDALRRLVPNASLWTDEDFDAAADAVRPAVAQRSAAAFSFVASPRLAPEITAHFASAAEAELATCFCNDAPLDTLPGGEGIRVWRRAGSASETGRWLHELRFLTAAGTAVLPDDVRVTFRFPAGIAEGQESDTVERVGLHPVEFDGGRPSHSWTGPGLTATLALPVAPTARGRITVRTANLGLNRLPDDVALALNGLALAAEAGDEAQIVADFEADPGAVAVSRIRLRCAHLIPPGADPRSLGIAVGLVTLELRLPAPPEV